jgi:hypothetical protein
MEGETVRWLRIETNDPTFLPELEAAHIDGLRASRDMEAGGTGLGTLLAIEIVRDLAAPLFVAWLYDHVIKHKRSKTTINGVEVPKDIQQLTALVRGGQVEQKPQRAPTQKNKKQRLHRKPPKSGKK